MTTKLNDVSSLVGLDKEELEKLLLIEEIVEKRAVGAKAVLEAINAERIMADMDAANDTNHTIYFSMDINEATVYDVIKHTSVWARRDPGQMITIKMNSPGGLVSETLALYDHLRILSHEGTPIRTIGIGQIASGAGIIFQAGDERLMTPNAFMLIHEASTQLRGKASAIGDDFSFLQRQQDKLLAIYAKRSNLTADEIGERWTGKEWWLDADEAVELGFADGVT